MAAADHLKEIISRQKEVLSQLEAEQKVLANSDLAKENAKLRTDVDKLRTELVQTGNNAAMLAEENKSLKNALYEQIYNEKIKIINGTSQKLNIYFRANIDMELNKLTALENQVRKRIDDIRETLMRNHIDIKSDLYEKIGELSALLDQRVTEARAAAVQPASAAWQEKQEGLEALKEEEITGEQIRSIARKNNLERFVGLNLLNVIGVFLLVIGAVTLARFTYVRLSDLLKGIMLFALGGGMLAAGEFMNRRKPNVFSLGISAGGVAILYVALATSYFGLAILGMYPAVLVCVLITVVAFVLSTRYHSQTIAVFALIGGYLPIYSIGSYVVIAYGAMVYFIVLNLLALMISSGRKWRVSAFTGLILNIIGTLYICFQYYDAEDLLTRVLLILYVLFTFLIYTAIPIVSTWRTKVRFRTSDVVLLAINTFCSSLIMYGVFYSFDLQDYHGLLAIAFAVIYLLLGKLIEKKFSQEERHMRALFYLTGLAFVVLIIPMQFGQMWLSLGWLAEGVLLVIYGILADKKSFRLPGFAVCLLCLLAFLSFDCTRMQHFLFVYKYLAITLGSILILGAYMYKKRMAGQFVKIYKYFVLVNTWLYFIYLMFAKLWPFIREKEDWPFTAWHFDYLFSGAVAAVTFALAYLFVRIRLLADQGTKIISIVFYILGILWLFANNMLQTPVNGEYLRQGTPAFGVTLAGTAVLILFGIMSVMAMYDLLKIIAAERRQDAEWYPLAISGYFIIVLIQNLITQYDLSFSSVVISIVFVLSAFAWTVYGFMRRYSFLRRFGLGLAILSVVKLFLIDLASLTQGHRIISYFALGITLIAISFVYQYFNKRLELKEEVSADEKKDI